MSRASEAAKKAYPEDWVAGYFDDPDEVTDDNEEAREYFQQGYELAEKDTLERVILWLKDNANKYIVDIGVGYGEHGRNIELVVGGKCWDDLKKAMEEDHE